jgi:NADH dehydrogenase FAD-containing subunit
MLKPYAIAFSRRSRVQNLKNNPCDGGSLLTFVRVGAGPTGVEMASAISDVKKAS